MKTLAYLTLAVVAFPMSVWAQQLPTDAQIQEMMAKQRAERRSALGAMDAAQGAQKPRTPAAVIAPSPPQIKGATPASQAKRDNLHDLIETFNKPKGQIGREGAVDLMVFVSFSMPPAVLKELSRQAKEAGAVVMLRGFKDGSLEETKRAALALNPGGAEWDIHPEAFKMFKVDKVPTFVVANASANSVLEDGCAPASSYASVSGNISIDLALDTIRRHAAPEGAAMAETRLAALKQARDQPRLRSR